MNKRGEIMKDHEEIRERLISFVLGEFSGKEVSEITRHLVKCQECSGEVKKLGRLLECAREISEASIDEQMCKSAKEAVLAVAEEAEKTVSRPRINIQNLWRIIMKSRITKLAAAAVIIVAAFICLSQFGSPFESVAWADVLENIRSSKTLTFIVRTTEQGSPVMKAMVIDPNLLRFEYLSQQEQAARLLGGDVLIVDTGKGEALILDTVNKTAKARPADKEMLSIYDTFRNFRGRGDFTVEEIGHRQVGDKQAVGFKLKKDDENREIMVWADPETKLPILIEETIEDREGQVGQFVVTDIVFDSELDVSLFSLTPPEGYEFKEIDDDPRIAAGKRLMSSANVHRILMACKKYVAEHNGQWPDSLQDLAEYGVDNKILVNPRQPALETGYIYLKPPASPSESRIVLYEVYGSWNDGINVGSANYHVEFMKEESDFKNRLGEH